MSKLVYNFENQDHIYNNNINNNIDDNVNINDNSKIEKKLKIKDIMDDINIYEYNCPKCKNNHSFIVVNDIIFKCSKCCTYLKFSAKSYNEACLNLICIDGHDGDYNTQKCLKCNSLNITVNNNKAYCLNCRNIRSNGFNCKNKIMNNEYLPFNTDTI